MIGQYKGKCVFSVLFIFAINLNLQYSDENIFETQQLCIEMIKVASNFLVVSNQETILSWGVFLLTQGFSNYVGYTYQPFQP